MVVIRVKLATRRRTGNGSCCMPLARTAGTRPSSPSPQPLAQSGDGGVEREVRGLLRELGQVAQRVGDGLAWAASNDWETAARPIVSCPRRVLPRPRAEAGFRVPIGRRVPEARRCWRGGEHGGTCRLERVGKQLGGELKAAGSAVTGLESKWSLGEVPGPRTGRRPRPSLLSNRVRGTLPRGLRGRAAGEHPAQGAASGSDSCRVNSLSTPPPDPPRFAAHHRAPTGSRSRA